MKTSNRVALFGLLTARDGYQVGFSL